MDNKGRKSNKAATLDQFQLEPCFQNNPVCLMIQS